MADYNSIHTGAAIDAAITKVAGIEAGADVTDTANVTAAGALMDSEVTNLAAVKAFDPTDYATAAQGTLADSAVQPADIALMVESDVTGVTGADAITNVISLTQAEYDAIGTPDAATLYVITG
jgi:pyruvate/oxaloacetate carboxyltransferase